MMNLLYHIIKVTPTNYNIIILLYWDIAIGNNPVSHEQILEEENEIAIILDDMIKKSKLKQGNNWLNTFVVKRVGVYYINRSDHFCL